MMKTQSILAAAVIAALVALAAIQYRAGIKTDAAFDTLDSAHRQLVQTIQTVR